MAHFHNVHGVLQARILKWFAIPFSSDSCFVRTPPWPIWKIPWCLEGLRAGENEDEMVGWHHWLKGHEFEQTLGDSEAWRAAVHGVTKSQIPLGDWTTTGGSIVKNLPAIQKTDYSVGNTGSIIGSRRIPFLVKEMATHSSILAWEIPWTEEPGWLQSMGSQELDTTQWLNHHHQQLNMLKKV